MRKDGRMDGRGGSRGGERGRLVPVKCCYPAA